jgi:Xaa-Pro aminopeptidase
MSSAGPERGFPAQEFEARCARARSLMVDAGLDVLLLTTEPEVRYFTGFLTPFWHSPTRPWFVVVPASGKPVAVIPSIGASLMAETWIDDVRTWSSPRPEDDGVSLVTDTLTELAGAAGVVGVPMGPETHLRMPLIDWARLTSARPDQSFVDATAIVMALRTVKSEREVAKVAHICSIASDGFEGLSRLLSTGMTEREAFDAFRIDLLQRGADEVPYLVGGTGRDLNSIIGCPSDRVIEAGDLLMFDTGARWDGYWCDFDRNLAFGSADDEAKRAYELVWRATEVGLAAVRPGARAGDLHRAMEAVLEEWDGSPGCGGGSGSRSVGGVGRMGHGLGMQLTEWPSNTADDRTELVENMVLTLEPGLEFAPGRVMVHEEDLVIRPDGAELLSRRAAPELPII